MPDIETFGNFNDGDAAATFAWLRTALTHDPGYLDDEADEPWWLTHLTFIQGPRVIEGDKFIRIYVTESFDLPALHMMIERLKYNMDCDVEIARLAAYHPIAERG